MDAFIGEAIAVAGTLAGACVGVGGTLLISRRERQSVLSADEGLVWRVPRRYLPRCR